MAFRLAKIQAEHGDLVAYDGRWWRKVERQAKEGEVILATDVYMNVTYERGDVLRVFRRFEYRNDGVVAARDSTHMCKLFDVEYVVLEPLADDKLHTYKGPDGVPVTYRKLGRKAKKGDTHVLLVAVDASTSYSNGEVLHVTHVYGSGDVDVTERNADGASCVFSNEFVVLEPLPPITPQLSGIERQDTLRGAMESLGDACKDLAWRLLPRDMRLMYARGRLATAEDELESLTARYGKECDNEAATYGEERADLDALESVLKRKLSLVEQAKHWRKEANKWSEEVAQIEREERDATKRTA